MTPIPTELRPLLERAIDVIEDGAHLKEHWDFAEELRAMLETPPADAADMGGQAEECQECERMARQVKHWQDLAVANRKVADDALAELAASDQALRESRANDLTTMATLADVRAELTALKAQQVGQHPDDAAVDRFAAAMKAKLARSREKGRHGWQNCTAPHLSAMLYDHLYKADPLDVGNFAMMLHQNGQAIELPFEARGKRVAPQPAPAQDVAELPPLGEGLRSILGRPNFACAGIAKHLRGMGYAIPQKAEEEQAATIHWLVNLYLKHGEDWATHANAALAAHDKQSGGEE